uniref:Uncharacterized protein n=1 Tax=Klebsiella pneumoniae TaxID=573 RepID=A0A1J0QZW0_KLEPN|nr:hypothetical protein [Klebsiella pneumoniae]
MIVSFCRGIFRQTTTKIPFLAQSGLSGEVELCAATMSAQG